MRFIKIITLSAMTSSVLWLTACSSTPSKTEDTASSGEPDLVAQLRERMASGKIQRQTKAIEFAPTAAANDTSLETTNAKVVTIDPVKQQMVAAVAADYKQALALMANNQDNEALDLLQKVADKSPELAGPVNNQIVILLRQSKFEDAEKKADQAVKVNSKNAVAYNLKGLALREQGKFKDAKVAYEKAVELDPKYAKAHYNLGVLCDLYLQELPTALSHYEQYQALQSTPDTTVAKWIIDLQKRTGVYKPPAPKPAPVVTPEENADSTSDDTTAASQQEVQVITPATPAPSSTTAPTGK